MCKKHLQTMGMCVRHLDSHLKGLGAERDVIVLTANAPNYEIIVFRDGSLTDATSSQRDLYII